MTKTAAKTNVIAFERPLGKPPVLRWIAISDLMIDERYQRSLAAESSQKLVRDIARTWDWRLCQPLSVAQRPDGSLYVMDGQHRLAGARLRPDIDSLPCVVMEQDDASQEAATFTNLNRRRRALNAVDIHRAQLVAGDDQAGAVADLIRSAGLVLAPHSNYTVWKPAMIYCVPGIASAYRRHGRKVVSNALVALSEAFQGQVLRYAGQLVRGLVVVYATEGQKVGFDPDEFIERLSANSQQQWMRKAAERTARTGDGSIAALAAVMLEAYRMRMAA